MDIKLVCNFDQMSAHLLFDEEEIKVFKLNKGQPGKTWGYFKYEHPTEGKLRYDIIIELADGNMQLRSNPRFYIYPMIGKGALAEEPIPIEVEGEWETYLKNHKHYHGR